LAEQAAAYRRTHLYLMTGNGDFDASVGDYGDSFLELTPDNSTQPTNKNGYGS
jgi:hypothetical protein